jgi:hypothetical protein
MGAARDPSAAGGLRTPPQDDIVFFCRGSAPAPRFASANIDDSDAVIFKSPYSSVEITTFLHFGQWYASAKQPFRYPWLIVKSSDVVAENNSFFLFGLQITGRALCTKPLSISLPQ